MKINIKNKDGEYRTKDSLVRSINKKIVKGGGGVKNVNNGTTLSVPSGQHVIDHRKPAMNSVLNIASRNSSEIKAKQYCDRYIQVYLLDPAEELLKQIHKKIEEKIDEKTVFVRHLYSANYSYLLKILQLYSRLYIYNFELLYNLLSPSDFNERMKNKLKKLLDKSKSIIDNYDNIIDIENKKFIIAAFKIKQKEDRSTVVNNQNKKALNKTLVDQVIGVNRINNGQLDEFIASKEHFNNIGVAVHTLEGNELKNYEIKKSDFYNIKAAQKLLDRVNAKNFFINDFCTPDKMISIPSIQKFIHKTTAQLNIELRKLLKPTESA